MSVKMPRKGKGKIKRIRSVNLKMKKQNAKESKMRL